jgi:hypothetical protein
MPLPPGARRGCRDGSVAKASAPYDGRLDERGGWAINAYLAEHNASPKPFVWTKSAEAILAKLDRCSVLSV